MIFRCFVYINEEFKYNFYVDHIGKSKIIEALAVKKWFSVSGLDTPVVELVNSSVVANIAFMAIGDTGKFSQVEVI